MLAQETAPIFETVLRSSVAKNAASLYVMQFANYVLPLIVVPYLLRTLGPTGYGAVAFGQSLIGYFAVFVQYGFGLSATRKISVDRNDLLAVSRTASNVWAAKLLLCVAGLALLVLLSSAVPKLREVMRLSLVLYGTVIGNALFPVWLFQGMEKMVFISFINLVVRLFVVVGIFTLVHQTEDYLIYAGLTSLGAIAAGVAGVGVALFLFRLRPVFPSRGGIRDALAEGWALFLSTSAVSLYTVGNAFILGALSNLTVVGYYSAGEKIVRAVRQLLMPVSQAAYPRFGKLASESRDLALQWGGRMLLVMGGLGLALSVCLFLGAQSIVAFVMGDGYEPAAQVVRILAPLPLLISASNVMGVQVMLPFGRDRAFTSIVVCAGLANVALAVLFVPVWREVGMGAGVLLSELFVTGTIAVYLWRSGLGLSWQIRRDSDIDLSRKEHCR